MSAFSRALASYLNDLDRRDAAALAVWRAALRAQLAQRAQGKEARRG